MHRELVKKAYANLPQTQKLVREQLASSGTFKTGSGQQQLLAPITAAAGEVATGAANLQMEKLKRKQQLISELNSFDNSVIKETFGFDKEALTNQLNFGTDAVVDEINNILSAMKDKQSAITGVVTGQANRGYAQQVGANETAASKLKGWSNLGGILAGYGATLTPTATTTGTTAPTTSSYSYPTYITDTEKNFNPNYGFGGYGIMNQPGSYVPSYPYSVTL
jgi:hypothetical protein